MQKGLDGIRREVRRLYRGYKENPGARTGLNLGEGESHAEEQRLDVSTRRVRLLG